MKVLLGISGASGATYGVRTLSCSLRAARTCTFWSRRPRGGSSPRRSGTARFPEAWTRGGRGSPASPPPPGRSGLYAEDDFGIPFASGSNAPDAMIVAPCSMGTLGRIAHGVSSSVLTRCADVALKERRPLVLVARETPLSVIHLENMLTLARAGAHILPACPGFYHRPETVSGLVDFVVSRALSCIGIDAGVLPRWGERKEE